MRARAYILVGILLVLAVVNLGVTWWEHHPATGPNRPFARITPHAPFVSPRPKLPDWSMPLPTPGVPDGESWLPARLSADDETRRAAANMALMRAGRLTDLETNNYRKLKQEMSRKQYALVDAQLDAVVALAVADPEYDLLERDLSDFAVANDASISLEILPQDEIDAWVAARPRSAWAHYVAANYLNDLAAQARTGKFADKVSQKQWGQMNRLNDKARHEVEQALQLNPKLAMAWNLLIGIDMMEGDPRLASDYQAARAQRPASVLIMDAYQQAIQPRWGGSYEQMASVVTLADIKLNPRFWGYKGSASADMGYTAVCNECGRIDWTASLRYYNDAIRYEERGSWLLQAAHAAVKLRRYALAYQYLERDARYHPNDISSFTRMQIMHELCSPKYDPDRFDLLRQEAAADLWVDTKRFPRMKGDCVWYQSELPWGGQPVPELGNMQPYLILNP